MAALLLVLVLLAALPALTVQAPPTPKTLWFNQTLDHNETVPGTFQQRYLVLDDYYNDKPARHNRPVFLCPGGEADVFAGYNHNGFMFDVGKFHGALLVFPEHRFYGQSLPRGPVDSYRKPTISLLTMEQAVHDYLVILDYVRTAWNVSQTAPVITIGGSYPGMLAGYMRLQHPNMIDAALASSAPVRYHQGVTPSVASGAFFKVVTESFARNDPNCPTYVRRAFAEIASQAKTAEGRMQVSKELRLCSPLGDGGPAVRLLNLWFESGFAYLAMINYPYKEEGFAASPLNAACSAMSLSNSTRPQSLVSRLADAIGFMYNYTGSTPCYNISDEYYPCADITGCGGGVGDPDAMSWDYQSCTQIVSNVDTNNVTDMFPPAPYDLAAVQAYCKKQWGTVPDPGYVGEMFSLEKLNATSRIIFSNGLLDPWWPGGVLENVNPKVIAVKIPDAAHHQDLREAMPVEGQAVREARIVEVATMSAWFAEIIEEKTAAARALRA
eukprot:m.126034 g.126034  ORF g.126034 m.126034 type:complete len:497 (-) comp16670_c0_seq3:163-1653(-)